MADRAALLDNAGRLGAPPDEAVSPAPVTVPRPARTAQALQVAILHWQTEDGISAMLCDEVARLGHSPRPFQYGAPMPAGADVLFSFGPYGPLLPIWRACAQAAPTARPVVVHWNTEGMPDLRLSKAALRLLSWPLSQVTWRAEDSSRLAEAMSRTRTWVLWKNRTARFRYTGDYLYAQRQGWLHILGDTSAVYTQHRGWLGSPAVYAPWGATPTWHADLQLARAIDVLWMGTRGTQRRSRLLDSVIASLRARGVNVYVADNIERPFIYGDERTEILNRAKITLNITRTWYDDNFSRFALAIPNRSLVISEPMLPHCPEFRPGVHYVSAPTHQLADTILHYLQHEDERCKIVERAYDFVTTELMFQKSVARLLGLAAQRVKLPDDGAGGQEE